METSQLQASIAQDTRGLTEKRNLLQKAQEEVKKLEIEITQIESRLRANQRHLEQALIDVKKALPRD